MLTILGSALLIILASVVVGRTAMLMLGWRRPDWLAGAVGLAVLVIAAPFLVRLPGRGLTAAILLALLVVVCAVVTRRAVPEAAGPVSGAPRAQHGVALAVVAITLALACLPFLFNERTGVLGEGVYTNDHAAQLYWADWLADGFGPQPRAVQVGYPVGPQALAAAASEGTTTDLIHVFNGLLLAIPALTALAALSLLAPLPPGRRAVAAILTGLPYLGASFLAQSGFKETAMALFVVGLAAALHAADGREADGSLFVATNREGGDRDSERPARVLPPTGAPPVRALVGVVALLAAGAVFTFSIPGGIWFGLAIPLWLILLAAVGRTRFGLAALREELARHRRLAAGIAVALVALGVVAIGPASGFIEQIDDVQTSSGRLSSPVFPGEALGIWPEGDFRVVRGDVEGALVATAFAGLCALGAGLALLRRREWGLIATGVAAVAVYAIARPLAEIHVEAKALAVLAPLAMLLTARWLLGPAERPGLPVLRLAVGALFAALALWSTFLALRAAPVGFDGRQRDLEELAERVGPDDDLLFLGVDRFAAYYLRGTLVRSPGGYVPPEVGARTAKTWQQGQALDFDTLEPIKLNRFEFAITTTARYQSTPPPSWHEVAREGDYVLWRRDGEGPAYEVLPEEGGDPGAVLECPPRPGTGEAVRFAEPIVGEQETWSPASQLEAPARASQVVGLPEGEVRISLQYHSQVPLTVTVDGDAVAELPPSLEGFYLVGAGRGAFWAAGEFASPGGPAEVTVEATEPSGFQELLGVRRRVWLGRIAFTFHSEPIEGRLADACGLYVDHYLAAP